jgi:hypothetical protein
MVRRAQVLRCERVISELSNALRDIMERQELGVQRVRELEAEREGLAAQQHEVSAMV